MYPQKTKGESKKLEIILHNLLERLKEIGGSTLQKIILFGSHARGENTGDSDIDILVIITDENEKEYDAKTLGIAVDLSIKFKTVLSIFVINREKFLEEKQFNPFIKNIENEGITVYEA